ncbi:MAG TPA: hypothetical protein VF556_09805 [Pyrinomonadaceae bacterium]|jgi:succinate dehydrogenase flavin-adding protein (antitoxin of CptAB toxin-antitoxin module)
MRRYLFYFTVAILAFGIGVFIALNSYRKTEQKFVIVQKGEEINSAKMAVENKTKIKGETVVLKVVDIYPEKAVLEFSNETSKTIYLFYTPNKVNDESTDVFRYWFRCKERGKKETDYNKFTSHVVPSLDPLEKNTVFRFEVSPLPKINAECKVSLLYYEDEKIVNLINNKILNLDDREAKSIEKAKKTAEIKFRINLPANAH